MHALNLLTCAIKDALSNICNTQLQAINDVCQIFEQWRSRSPAPSSPSTYPNLTLTAEPCPRVHMSRTSVKRASRPNAQPIPRIPMPLPISPATTDVQTPRVHFPISKGLHPQPIALCTQACKSTPTTDTTPNASLKPTNNAPMAQ